MEFISKPLLSKGSFGYNGGIYNPSCLKLFKDLKVISFRCEYDYCTYEGGNWFKTIPDIQLGYYYQEKLIALYNLKKIGFENNSRLEDCRIFFFNEKIYFTGVILTPNNKTSRVFIAKLNETEIHLIHIFESPNNRIEKNWGFFEKFGKLFLLYSISPFCIFSVNSDFSLELVEIENFNGNWIDNDMLCLSSLPVEYEGNFLIFFHTKDKLFYNQGALIFSKDFKILNYTSKPFFKPKDLNIRGRNKRVFYISSINVLEEEIELYFGEGDTNSKFLTINRKEFNSIIYK